MFNSNFVNEMRVPKVSVLLSNYNTPEAELRTALDSVVAQTVRDIEIVIINDGSEDKSKEILYEYAAKDDRIRVIENGQNRGLSYSLNRGVGECRGEYIARMDTDDICYPDRLEKQVRYMDEHPGCILSGAWADVFEDDDGSVITETWKPVMCPTQEEYHIRLLFANNPLIIHPTAIFRRELLVKSGVNYDASEEYKHAEDYRMWYLCSRAGAVGILEDVVIKYRNANSDTRITVRHSDSMKKCNFNNQKDQLSELGIDFEEEWYEIHYNLLSGRKPYDIRYRKWIDLLIEGNKKNKVYDEDLFVRLLHDRWYNITYYGIAYEKSIAKRIKYFGKLYPDGKKRFIKEIIKKK